MRLAPLLALTLLAATAACSGSSTKALPANVRAWQAGDAVVVLVADVASGPNGDLADYGSFMKRPGVISVSSKDHTLRLAFSRRALLVDMAALKLELQRTPGLSNVRETIVPPAVTPG